MRQVRSSIQRLTDDDRPAEDLLAVDRVLQPTLAKAEISPPDDAERTAGPRAILERRLGSLVCDPDRPYGLRRTLRDLGGTASLARDRLSADSWHILRQLQPEEFARKPGLALPSRRSQVASVLPLLDQGIQRLAAFSGMGMENMTRSFGWRFHDMGRRIERSVQTAALLDTLRDAEEPEDDGSLILLLEIADSFMTYRSRYLNTPQLAPVVDLLLLDESNPRSVAFQLTVLTSHLELIPKDPSRAGLTPHQDLVGATDLCRRDRQGNRPGLSELLARIARDLPELTTGITRTYFTHVDAVHTVSEMGATRR
jgi:uncharacterized alpha-E superfamily protein